MSGPATLEETLAVLRARRDAVRAHCRVELIGVAGSLARGEAGPDSDADIVADFLEGSSLFKIARVELELEDALARPVELVNRRRLRPPYSEGIERDLVLV